MQLAIIGDTHLPKGTRRLPAACVERLKAADLIIHAGDFSRFSVLEEIRSYGTLIAVHGNVDDYEVRQVLPATDEVEVGGACIAIVHDGGLAQGRVARLRRRFPQADAVVFGHSHIPLHQSTPDGFQIFNPGSPTERRRAPRHTMGIADARNGTLTFELIELD